MTALAAVCRDFYVNQRLGLTLDLPSARETILNLFDRVRKERPAMGRFRRFEDELALESADFDGAYHWLALNRTAIRSGWVNPDSLDSAYDLHRMILDIAPYFLSISPLDVEHVELLFGFDIECRGNRNDVVFDAFFADSPLGGLLVHDRETLIETQPMIAFTLDRAGDVEAVVEVKTRTNPAELVGEMRHDLDQDPISVFLTVRRHGPFGALSDLQDTFARLAGSAERLAEERVIPQVVMPIRERACG